MDARMITKMIKEGILSEITILICDPPGDGKFFITQNWPEVHFEFF